jgi:HAD superfamily hydrolase (TIGR01549 family)
MYLQEKPARFHTIKELLAVSVKKASEKFNLPDISDEVEEVYRNNHLINSILYEDALPAIEKLKKEGIKLILLSDADADVLTEQLRRFGILEYFDGVIISSHIGAYKPSDATVKEALKYCDEPLSGILFVGDNVGDMKTAEKMKVKSVLIRRNGRFSVDADYKITNLNQIFDIISKVKRK